MGKKRKRTLEDGISIGRNGVVYIESQMADTEAYEMYEHSNIECDLQSTYQHGCGEGLAATG